MLAQHPLGFHLDCCNSKHKLHNIVPIITRAVVAMTFTNGPISNDPWYIGMGRVVVDSGKHAYCVRSRRAISEPRLRTNSSLPWRSLWSHSKSTIDTESALIPRLEYSIVIQDCYPDEPRTTLLPQAFVFYRHTIFQLSTYSNVPFEIRGEAALHWYAWIVPACTG